MTTAEEGAAPVTFVIATEWTGVPHSVEVQVHADQDAMIQALQQGHPIEEWTTTNDAGERVAGVFVNASGFWSTDAPERMGTIYLNQDHLDIQTLVHEAVHACLFIYECDLIRTHSRARAHMNGTNETIACMVGEFVDRIGEQLLAHRLYDRDRAAA